LKNDSSKLRLNKAVLTAHVVLISMYTLLSIFVFNVKAVDGSDTHTVNYTWDHISTAWTFFGAIADLFIVITLWYITDKFQAPVIITLANRSTLVLDVIRPTSYAISEDEDSQDKSLS